MSTTVEGLLDAERRIREGADALGGALQAIDVFVPPAIARAVTAKENLYDRIGAEFGLLAPGEAGRLLGSQSSAPRNQASQLRRAGRLLAITRGRRSLYPGFQFGPDGQPLPVIAELRELADRSRWSESGVVQWLMAPTTYLQASERAVALRPVDLLVSDPVRVVAAAEKAWNVEW